jgi:hypothetical protein
MIVVINAVPATMFFRDGQMGQRNGEQGQQNGDGGILKAIHEVRDSGIVGRAVEQKSLG